MRQLATFGRYLKERFGIPVSKVPLSLSGFTCPNIDGSVARGGCTYCENESFSPNLLAQPKSRVTLNLSMTENPLLATQLSQLHRQYRQTSEKLKKRTGAKGFLAYFQSFSNTYAPVATLRRLYETALKEPGCVGISVGTRADCVNDAILDLLAELSRTHEVWVEYGIQSSNDTTLEAINRGETFAQVDAAIRKSKARGLNVCGHFIFGLPGEDEEMMLKSVRDGVAAGIDAVKIHPLYVVKNTALANRFTQGSFTPIGEEAYISALVKAIALLPENVLIQRMTAGIDDSSLLAPSWCREKNRQMAAIRRALAAKGLVY